MKLIMIIAGLLCLLVFLFSKNYKNNKPYQSKKAKLLYSGITFLFFSILA